MTPRKKTKIALDENRMSILGVQILFGFQLQAPFQQMFDTLPESSRFATVLAFGLLIGAVALLITPSAHHRIVTRHGAEGQLQHSITWLIDISLLLLGLAIGIDLYLVGDRVLGGLAGPLFGIGFCLVAFVFWYGIELMHLTKRTRPLSSGNDESKLEDRIDYVLTEARVVLPGVQALLGFQLIVILTSSFDALPQTSVLVHLGALAAIAISAVLLIAPAAHHRIVFGGEDAEEFLPIASAYLLAATVFLALGMAADCYVIVAKVLGSSAAGVAAAGATAAVCLGLWHIWPWMMRKR
jgi:hypothetical protein